MYFLVFSGLYVCILFNTASVWAHISTNETFDWMSNDKFKNTSFSKWTSNKDTSKAKFATKSLFLRNLQDTKIKHPSFSNYALDELNKQNNYKAIPLEIERIQSFRFNEHPVHRSTVFSSPFPNINKPVPNNAQATLFSHSHVKQETYNLPSSYKAATDFHTDTQNLGNSNYLHAQSKPILYVDNFVNPEANTRHILYLQHGKCSNSVEISRIRDIQIKSSLKYGLHNQEAVCVLMLYTTSENNKLAVSLQPTGESISSNITNTVNWLEESVKVFPLYEGKIKQLHTK